MSWLEQEVKRRLERSIFGPAVAIHDKAEAQKRQHEDTQLLKYAEVFSLLTRNVTLTKVIKELQYGIVYPEKMSKFTYLQLRSLHRTLCSVAPVRRDHDVLFSISVLLNQAMFVTVKGKGCISKTELVEGDEQT